MQYWSSSLFHITAADHGLGSTSLKASRDTGDVARRMLEDLARNPTHRAGAWAEPGSGVSGRSCPTAGSHEVPKVRSHSHQGPSPSEKSMH